MLRLFLLCFCFMLARLVHATDIPAGNVSGTWSPAGNPYIINGNIRVAAGEQLQILPGTQVLFSAAYLLRVVGDFDCQGAPGDSILFGTVAGNDHWTGIRMDSLSATSDTVRISHCTISKMYHHGIKIVNTGKVVISDSRIHHNTNIYVGVIMCTGGDPVIRDNIFHNNSAESGSGNYGQALYIADASPLVTGNTFTHYTGAPTYNYGAMSIWRYDETTAPVVVNNVFEGYTTSANPAMDIHSNCTPVITGNIFRHLSTAYSGSALWIGYVQVSELQITGNQFLYNHATQNGGVVYVVNTRVRFTDNLFDHNTTGAGGSAIYAYDDSEVAIVDSRFSFNDAAGQGGALHFTEGTSFSIDRCMFHNNEAISGGALYVCSVPPATITNSIFANNNGTSIAGAVYCYLNTVLTFSNCNIVHNSSPVGAAIYLYWNADPVLTNCILWGNRSGETVNNIYVQDYIWHYCEPSFYNCLVEGGQATFTMGTSSVMAYENNLEVDPQFVAPTAGAGTAFDASYASWNVWQESSPVIDNGTGDPTSLNLGLIDYAGNDRLQGSALDIGAYEGGFVISPADFNLDGLVDVLDLEMLLNNYGCFSSCGVTDLDGDGIVGSSDVQLFIGWY